MNKLYVTYILFFCLVGFSGYASSEAGCQIAALERTQKMIRIILDDVAQTYTKVGGGGITKINGLTTNSYMVSISQEERIDQITYELMVNQDCTVSIINKKLTAYSPWNS